MMVSKVHIWRLILLSTLGLMMWGMLSTGADAVLAEAIDEGGDNNPGISAQTAWPQVTVATITFQDRAELDRLAERLDILTVDHAARTFDALLRPDQLAALQAEGRTVRVDVAQSAQLNAPRTLAPGQVNGIPNFACYRTVEETYASLEQLAAAHPTLAAWSDVGDSWEKATPGGSDGYDINALVLTNQALPGPKPKLMIISAIHAREYATAELATRFAELLVNNYGIDPDITWLLDYTELHLIPQANPDGRKQAESGYSWRKNVNNSNGCTTLPYYGTDLNRNSSFMWNTGGSSGYACDELYRGPSAASEPEVQAVQGYAAAIFPDQKGPNPTDPAPESASGVFLTLHSYGQLVLYPWGFTTTDAPNGPALATLGRKFGFFNGYTVCQDCLYAVSGSTDDWVYGELGVPSYTFEVGTTFFQSCAFFEQNILPLNMPALLYAFKSARLPYQAPKGPEVIQAAVSLGEVAAGTAVTLTASADDSRYNSNGYGNEPVQTVAAARFSVDSPPWAANVVFYPIQAADGSLDSPVENLTATLDTAGWSSGRHTVYLQAQDDLGNWGVPSAVFLTVAAPAYAMGVDAPPPASAAPGATVSHPLIIANRGNSTDSYTLTLSGDVTWPVEMASSAGPVAPSASAKISVTVQIPLTATHGERHHFTVTVTSVGDAGQAISVPMTTTAQIQRGVTATPITTSVSSGPGAVVTLTVSLRNTGNMTDSFDLIYTSTQQFGWIIPLLPGITLGPGETTQISLAITVPAAAPEGTYTGQLQAISQADAEAVATMPVSVQVVWRHVYFPEIGRP